MDCAPAPNALLSREQVATRLIRMAQEAELAGYLPVAIGLVELAYAVLDGAGRQ